MSWTVAKEKWRSKRDRFESERLPLVVVLLNIHVNVKATWLYEGSDGYIEA